MKKVEVRIFSETGKIPEYKTDGSAGFDLAALAKPDHPNYISPEDFKDILDTVSFKIDNNKISTDVSDRGHEVLNSLIRNIRFTVNFDLLDEPSYMDIILTAFYKYTEGRDLNEAPNKGIYLIPPQTAVIIPTGIRMEIPVGYECQIRPRSSISAKTGLSVKFGTIDSDYRGDIAIILQNQSLIAYIIEDGDRLAQGVINELPKVTFNQIKSPEELEATGRGESGFGSTGIK